MKNRLFYLFVLVILFFTSISWKHKGQLGSIDDKKVILWDERKLTWEDFLGVPDSTSKYKALTSTEIKTDALSFNKDELVYDISCRFEKNKSWTKVRKNSLLKHEQLHFDIAELATRRMREKFCKHKSLDPNSINLMIDKIFEEAVKERRTLNNAYDLETNHGIIEDKQIEWEEKIDKELKKLEKYTNTQVIIKRIKG